MTQQPTPPGWHSQPDGRERYWDGHTWTEQYRGGPGVEATPPAKKKRGWVVPAVTGIAGLIIGGAAGGAGANSGNSTTQTASPTVTVTRTIATPAAGSAAPAAPAATTTVTVTVTAPAPADAPPGATITEGIWTVGKDIAPGRYRTTAAVTSGCYWSITRTGTTDIVDNGLPSGGFPQVTLKAGQDFETKRCGDWAKVG